MAHIDDSLIKMEAQVDVAEAHFNTFASLKKRLFGALSSIGVGSSLHCAGSISVCLMNIIAIDLYFVFSTDHSPILLVISLLLCIDTIKCANDMAPLMASI